MKEASFRVLDASNSEEFHKWLALWNQWPGREIFAHPNYVKLYADQKNRALCALLESPEGYVLYPFIYRDLKREDFCNLNLPAIADIITPYGYGGPFAWGYENLSGLSGVFWPHFDAWVHSNNIVSEVIRFSLFKKDMLIYPGTKEEKLQNIVVSLDLSEPELWMSFEHKVRKNVKRARQMGVSVIVDREGERLDDFFAIYNSTMHRRKAKHPFPLSFFQQIKNLLPSQFAYFHAVYKEKIISTELVLFSSDKAYSFLGGNHSDNFNLRPSDLLKYEIMHWVKEQGKNRYVLGGGNSRYNDGVYNFKHAFAPKGSLPFFIGYRIFNHDLYNSLIENKKSACMQSRINWVPKTDYVPAYRT